MSSVNYNSCIHDLALGNINFGSDTFYAMLVTSAYTPDKDAHLKRSNVTNEVTGTGYTAGGAATACTVAKDLVNDKITLTFAGVTWPAASITARGAVIYKRRGGASTADELVAYVDFGADIASTNGDFVASFSTPLTIQN